MPKAESTTTTEEPIATQVANGLSALESPILRARDLAYAMRMAASSSEMPSGADTALDVLADTIVDQLNELEEERNRLCSLARTSEGGE
jgi:hypothetical protein